MLDLYKKKFNKIEKAVAKIFSFFPFTPNQYTLLSIFFGLGTFFSLVKGNLILALFFFVGAGLLDFIDGAIAREKNLVSKKGAYLDTICDRYIEALLLLGMLFLPLPKIFFPPHFWIFLILFGSLMTTYAKAAAKEKELTGEELKGGFFSRAERIIFLAVSLILGILNKLWMVYLLILIAILTNFTAIQRIISVLKLRE